MLTGIGTAALAVGAIVTAVLAYLAFRKQAREVRAIESQVADGQELTRQQAELIKIQTGQLEALRSQLEEQRKASAAQAEVLQLQAEELQESLKERKRQAELARGYQARRVFLTKEPFGGRTSGRSAGDIRGIGAKLPSVTATAYNTSDQPIYDAEFRWHLGSAAYGDPNPELIGTLLPGAEHSSAREFPPGANLEASGAVLCFRDAAGAEWMRRPDGGLTEQAHAH
jgi:hypothetical protein